ncbi:hypothetical protein BB558_002254 [Smittium angustum]|uniref:Uncharacterized protein n=1 Tax=Smittium angustum TaxID=133377 RepID=A0A2U1J972_SMIAN|nr:hypothetical protein BB558_002254 [Smittium angustum]
MQKPSENIILAGHNPNGFGWQTPLGELKAWVFQLHASRDFSGADMMLDTASYLTHIVAPRANITSDIVSQHALLNQRPMIGRDSLQIRVVLDDLKAWVFQLHASRDFSGADMMLDTASYLTHIVAPRANITSDIVSQHALLNQRPMIGRDSLQIRVVLDDVSLG